MRLYLDEDTVGVVLIQLLRNDGHDVETPADVGLMGEADPVQLTYAIKEERVFLTRNYGDFEELHNLIRVARGHHAGILVIRRDNNPKRNMMPRDIARALRNLQAAGVPIVDQYIVLNGWQ